MANETKHPWMGEGTNGIEGLPDFECGAACD